MTMTSPQSAIQLGPFLLHEVVGRGGMGDVWRGTHATQDLEVALKVVTTSRARNPRALAAFRNEVLAMARLDHPGIVLVFDVGEVTAEAAEASAGILTAEHPVLAMEYATHGTLDRVRDGLHWRRLRAVLLSILDALAHAHARGVIHRDLKPGNVLVTSDHRGRPVLKLADFGLAHAVYRPDAQTSERKVSGTPKYMAPEQIEGRIRDQGPWTDLYALGCLSYWMLHGQPPFDGELDAVLAGHLFDAPPALEPNVELPPGFEAWIQRLLAKSPRDRYRCAADAAWGLMMLDDTGDEDFGELGGLDQEITDAKWTEPELSVIDETVVMDSQAGTASGGSRGSRPLAGFSATIVDLPPMTVRPAPEVVRPARPLQRPPIPPGWQRKEARAHSMQVVGAGLGLYGLRPIPIVGRDAERSAMWDALREVHDDHDMRAVVLSGAAGAGKSRLAEWLCERASEVGAATVLRAFHGPETGLGHGLGGMLGDFLRCVGIDHAETVERVQNFYFASGAVDGQDLYDTRAIAEIIAPGPADAPDAVKFGRPTERWVVVSRFLARVAADRPLIVWLDDVHWGLDALDYLRFELSTGRMTPVLFVLTARAATEQALEFTRIEEICNDTRARRLDVGPLSAFEHERLVQELLSLEPELAAEVAARTDGNPLFAVHLVGDWIQRGLLVVSDRGFVLADDGVATLPDSIHELWVERIEHFLAKQTLPDLARRQIELAAVLGTEVDHAEWTEACGYLGDSGAPGDRLVELLIKDGLVVRRRGGFAFSHGMLQESLVRVAQEVYRAPVYHRAAAQMLRERYPDDLPEVQERLGTHLYAAADREACLDPLLAAATTFGERCDFDRAKRLVAMRDEALDALGAADHDERRAEGWHVVVRCNLRAGLVEDAAALIERGVALGRKHRWPTMLPEFELHVGSLARKRGQSDIAIAGYRAGLEAFEAIGNQNGVAKGLYGIGEVMLYRGEVQEAVDYLQRALDHMTSHDLREVGVVITGLVAALIKMEKFDEARARLGDAIDAFRRVGNRGGRAAALNMLGELERARGELVPAEVAYREALQVLESIGSRGTTIPRLNLGLVYLARKKWAPARVEFTTGLDDLLAIGEESHVGFVHLALCCAAGGLGDWDEYDEHLDLATAILDATNWVDRDIAEHAELAAELARLAGETERAVTAQRLAADQWQALRGQE